MNNSLIIKFFLFLISILICFNLLDSKKDPELEGLKSILVQDRFKLEGFPADWNKPIEDRTEKLPDKVFQDLIKSDNEYYKNVNYENYELSDNEKRLFKDVLKHLPKKYLKVLEKKLKSIQARIKIIEEYLK